MLEGGRQGGQLPPQILADQKVPPGSGGAPHYYLTMNRNGNFGLVFGWGEMLLTYMIFA